MSTLARILIIDDDPDQVAAARMTLEAQGYEVQSASDGEEGLRRMRAERPNVVLLDVMLSHMLEGVAVVREMIADPELVEIPVIMISSIEQRDYEDLLPTADSCFNAIALLTKPVQPEVLAQKIREALATPLHCEFPEL